MCSDDRRTFRAHVHLLGWCNQLIGLKPRQIGIQSRVQPGTTNLHSEGLNETVRAGKRQRGDKPTEGPVVCAGPRTARRGDARARGRGREARRRPWPRWRERPDAAELLRRRSLVCQKAASCSRRQAAALRSRWQVRGRGDSRTNLALLGANRPSLAYRCALPSDPECVLACAGTPSPQITGPEDACETECAAPRNRRDRR